MLATPSCLVDIPFAPSKRLAFRELGTRHACSRLHRILLLVPRRVWKHQPLKWSGPLSERRKPRGREIRSEGAARLLTQKINSTGVELSPVCGETFMHIPKSPENLDLARTSRQFHRYEGI